MKTIKLVSQIALIVTFVICVLLISSVFASETTDGQVYVPLGIDQPIISSLFDYSGSQKRWSPGETHHSNIDIVNTRNETIQLDSINGIITATNIYKDYEADLANKVYKNFFITVMEDTSKEILFEGMLEEFKVYQDQSFEITALEKAVFKYSIKMLETSPDELEDIYVELDFDLEFSTKKNLGAEDNDRDTKTTSVKIDISEGGLEVLDLNEEVAEEVLEEVLVDSDIPLNIIADNDSEDESLIINELELEELPATGGVSSLVFILIGLSMIILGTILIKGRKLHEWN